MVPQRSDEIVDTAKNLFADIEQVCRQSTPGVYQNPIGWYRMIRKLGFTKPSASSTKGFRYELQSAAHLSKGPPPVRIERFEEYIPMHPTEWKSKKGVVGASQPHWRTDIDFQDAEGVMYNSKRGWGFDEADAARRAENWIRAVQHEKNLDFDKIKFVVPEGTEVPEPVKDALTAMIARMQGEIPGLGERLGDVSDWSDFFRLDGPRKPID